MLPQFLRRRVIGKDSGWVDAYGLHDQGRSRAFHSRLGENGHRHGNPPGMCYWATVAHPQHPVAAAVWCSDRKAIHA